MGVVFRNDQVGAVGNAASCVCVVASMVFAALSLMLSVTVSTVVSGAHRLMSRDRQRVT